jgi:hypothetical protein
MQTLTCDLRASPSQWSALSEFSHWLTVTQVPTERSVGKNDQQATGENNRDRSASVNLELSHSTQKA